MIISDEYFYNNVLFLLDNKKINKEKKVCYCKCPVCGKNEFGISLEYPFLYGCFRAKNCGIKGNIFTLLKILNLKIDKENIQYKNLLNFNFNIEEDEKEIEYTEIKLPILYKRVFECQYIEQRGFDIETFNFFNIGESKYNKNYVYFPIQMFNKNVGYLSRYKASKKYIDDYNKTHDNKIRRYNNSKSNFENFLYNFDNIKETVFIVEGVFGVFNLYKLLDLYNDKNISCVATFGKNISNQQIKLLLSKNVKNVILFQDNDIIDKTKSNIFTLENYFEKVDIITPPLNKDSGDVDLDELLFCIDNKFTPFEFYNKNFELNYEFRNKKLF